MFGSNVFQEVNDRFQERRDREEALAKDRTLEAEGKNPLLKETGKLMRGIGLRVLEISMQGGPRLSERMEKLKAEQKALVLRYGDLLEEMGYPRDYTKVRRVCEKCQDSGFADGKMCACMKKEVVLAGYRNSGVGKLLEKQRFDNFDLSFYSTALLEDQRYSPRDVMAEILGRCREYADTFSTDSPSLLFIGGTGLGKTHLSSAIAGKVIEKGFDVVYETASGAAAIFEKERFRSEEEASGTARLFDAELLILDDLGTEPVTGATSSAIYRLINHRASILGKPTIISTNLSYRQLEKQYDTATLSRLLGEFEVKLFQGSDIRMAKLK